MGITVIYGEDIKMARSPVQQSSSFEYLLKGEKLRQSVDTLGEPASHCHTGILPKLTELVSRLPLDCPSMFGLGDFNIHQGTPLTGASPDLTATMITINL